MRRGSGGATSEVGVRAAEGGGGAGIEVSCETCSQSGPCKEPPLAPCEATSPLPAFWFQAVTTRWRSTAKMGALAVSTRSDSSRFLACSSSVFLYSWLCTISYLPAAAAEEEGLEAAAAERARGKAEGLRPVRVPQTAAGGAGQGGERRIEGRRGEEAHCFASCRRYTRSTTMSANMMSSFRCESSRGGRGLRSMRQRVPMGWPSQTRARPA